MPCLSPPWGGLVVPGRRRGRGDYRKAQWVRGWEGIRGKMVCEMVCVCVCACGGSTSHISNHHRELDCITSSLHHQLLHHNYYNIVYYYCRHPAIVWQYLLNIYLQVFSHKNARNMNGLGGFLHSSDCDTDNINIGVMLTCMVIRGQGFQSW